MSLRASHISRWFSSHVTAGDKWTLVIASVALIVSVWAAIVTQSQLRLDRNAAGGRGILFWLRRRSRFTPNDGGPTMDTYRVTVELFGPGVRHGVALILERDGIPVDRFDEAWADSPDTRKSMSCDDERIEWDIEIPASAIDDLWCVLTWTDPDGEALWSGAYAIPLTNPSEMYLWRWHRSRRTRRAFQHWGRGSKGPDGFRYLYAAKVRSLGRWNRVEELGIADGQGPIKLGVAPDVAPRPRRMEGGEE